MNITVQKKFKKLIDVGRRVEPLVLQLIYTYIINAPT